jgi:hypothetical protein
MSVLLPAGLPAGCLAERATGAHAQEAFEMREGEFMQAFGFCQKTAGRAWERTSIWMPITRAAST